jgi:hypothetical protein
MKNVFLALALLVSTVSAQATSLHPDTFAEVAKLTKLSLDKEQFAEYVVGAEVKLNTVRNVISLRVDFKQMCPRARPGQVTCLAIGRPPMVIELPIVSVRKSDCGDVYVAKQDRRPVDGNFEQIVLKDMRAALCEIVIPADGMTQVEYKLISAGMDGRVRNFKSKLSGEALHGYRSADRNIAE